MPISISSKTRVRGVGFFFFGFGGALFDADFQGQHDAGHFAAGGDFVEGFERLAGVGGDAVFDWSQPLRRSSGILTESLQPTTAISKRTFMARRVDLGFG